MKSRIGSALVVFAGLLGGASAQTGPGHAANLASVDLGVFKSADLNGDGRITRSEIAHFADLVFLSMDANGDEVLTLDEFKAWDVGYFALAERLGRNRQMNETKEEIFRLRDLNGDGRLDLDEYLAASLYDYFRADLDKNRSLDQNEFLNEYQIIRLIRNVAR